VKKIEKITDKIVYDVNELNVQAQSDIESFAANNCRNSCVRFVNVDVVCPSRNMPAIQGPALMVPCSVQRCTSTRETYAGGWIFW